MNALEQLGRMRYSCKGSKRRIRRVMKRATAKCERRVAKRLLEDAPPRHYNGWAD